MAKVLDMIPENLQSLLPEKVKEAIVIGDKAYELYPLTEGMCEDLLEMVSEIFHEMFSDRGEGKVSDFDILTRKGRVAKFLSRALDMQEDDIRNKLTTSQLMHVAGVLYKQNFTLAAVPETSRGFVVDLWNKLFKKKDQPVGVEFEMLRTKMIMEEREQIPKEELLRLMDSLKPFRHLEGMNSSPVNTAGNGSTSEGDIIGNVPSSMGRVGTGNSGKATVSPAKLREFKERSLSGKKIASPAGESVPSNTD